MAEIGHNSGLGVEEASAAMARALAPYGERRTQFIEGAAKIKADDLEDAEDVVDFIRMAKALEKKAYELKRETSLPYDESLAAIRGVADDFIDGLIAAREKAEDVFEDFEAKRKARADAVRKEQEEAERQLAQQAEPDATPEKLPVEQPEKETAPPKPAKIRTKLGGQASRTEKWRPVVEDVTKVPAHVLNAPKVIEAITSVARSFMQHGMEIDGIKRETYTSTQIR